MHVTDDNLIWIKSNCFTSNPNRLNNWVNKSSWWENNGKLDLYRVLNGFGHDSITESLWNLFNTRRGCLECNAPTTFKNFRHGYHQYCSIQCVTKSSKRNDLISTKLKEGTAERIQKGRATKLKKYGIEDLLNCPIQQQKMRESKLNRYGRIGGINEEKRRNTNLERYGYLEPLENPNRQKLMQDKKLEKYGSWFPGYENQPSSKGELQVLSFIRDFAPDITKNIGILPNNMELDGYSEKFNIAIEYCGLYWHCEIHKKPFYHKYKHDQCEDRGIKLITIFEDEWNFRNKQVKNFIKSSFGIFDRRIYARDCQFVEIDIDSAINFCADNHIQGASQSNKRAFGLLHENQLVAVITYGHHHRYGKNNILNRLCFIDGIQIIGGASKIIKNSINQIDGQVITWSDNRWSSGEIYKKSGFTLDGNVNLDYSYANISKGIRLSKQSQQKRLTGCPKEIKEYQWANQHGLYRIWDCGKKRWKYDR